MERPVHDKNGDYAFLPREFRDFHDQKDLFKTMHEQMAPCESIKGISWVAGQCYVCDVVLKYLSLHGYYLQRSRSKKYQFRDINAAIAERHRREVAQLKVFLDHQNIRTKEVRED